MPIQKVEWKDIILVIIGFIFKILAGIFLYISQVWPEWAQKIFLRNK